jgi:hypothetical protein
MRTSTATYLVELAVGLGCLAGAVAAWRLPRVRWLAVVLGLAGLAAVGHAVLQLA